MIPNECWPCLARLSTAQRDGRVRELEASNQGYLNTQIRSINLENSLAAAVAFIGKVANQQGYDGLLELVEEAQAFLSTHRTGSRG